MRPLRVLIVEDSENDTLLLLEHLRAGGYEPDYTRVESAEALNTALEGHEWDMVIADYTMPGFSGTAALSIVRSRGLEVPFIFVSGTIGEDIAVEAMKNGANDYIIKNNLNRLLPAINRELRDAEVRRERTRAEERIRHLAYYDPLTDLPNRTLFQNRLEQAVHNSLRARNPLAVMIMDLDTFKEINDTLGHLMGDAVLREIGHRLATGLRESDTVARLGGDEFAVMLPNVGRAGAELAARKLLALVQEPLAIEGVNLDVHSSVGIALFPEHGTEAELLIQRADVAMYVAKQDRSGHVVYAQELDRHSPERLALMGDFRHAISRDQLRVHYQPKLNLKTNQVSGVEALVRWQHPELGLIMPDRFIPMAEQTGAVRPLTLWMLERALQQCLEWRRQGVDLVAAVNLSPRNLQDPELPERVRSLLNLLGAPAQMLELEITESVIMSDPLRSLQVLTRLNKMGLRLAVDDFGTGYSSFSYLRKLPVHEIKIDKSFIDDMIQQHDEVIVQSTIDLAHNLGLTVVAEGVQDKETLDRLRELGCDTAQGDYLSAPLDAPSVLPWLRARESQQVVQP
ncbi:MAG TPA: GGDEF domain-containing response regulator [Vicinamibacterales bacterium]|nr:GGDEF domain-containing response regulator [Vicinamibacterales bacterium]